MENKINIAEILNGCPQGLKLYSPIFGDVYLSGIRPHLAVIVKTSNNQKEEFLYDGRFGINGECMLFPSKENRDWSTFKRPFKDGDVITCTNSICSFVSIFKELHTDSTFKRYVSFTLENEPQFLANTKNNLADFKSSRFATEEEKQKLFKAIKENGYKWNPETKTLEKLVKPKFKVGNRIRKENNNSRVYTINGVYNSMYGVEGRDFGILIKEQDEWELVSNKFDITTLKPFDKVLVRDNNEQKWTTDMFSFYDKNLIYSFVCVGHYPNQCIPYEGNEHLIGKQDECDEFFKTWE